MASIEKRIREDGTTSYRVKIRLKGRSPETATFKRMTDARAWAKKIEADMTASRHFGVSKRHTVAELLDRYAASELPSLKSADTVKAKLDWWRDLHGDALLSNMTPEVMLRPETHSRRCPRNAAVEYVRRRT